MKDLTEPSVTTYYYEYDQNGNRTLVEIKDDGLTLESTVYEYDRLNKMIRSREVTASGLYIYEYTYDDNGNLKAETIFIYDALGRSENNFKTEYSYDENGRNTSIESYVWNNGQWVLDSVERYDYAEAATCMNNINSMVAKSSVKKVINNGRINIHIDGKSFNLNGIED